METYTLNIDGNELLFVNNSRSTRNGFAHDSILLINGEETTTAHCYYLNRTWESFKFQSSMKLAIKNLIENLYDNMGRAWMKENNFKRLTKKREVEFENYIKDDGLYQLYKKALLELN